jgi:hypothetical protein
MSSNITWTEIRRGMGDQMASVIRGLINKQNMFINAQEQPTQQRARGIGRATHDRLTYQDPFTWSIIQEFKDRFFLPPMEPDGKFLTVWIPMKSLGRYLKDLSHFKNHAYMKGIPHMCRGPDDQLFGGRIALEFNHTDGQDDYLYIPHSNFFSMSALATGINVFARVKFNSFETSGGIDATICQMIDTPSAASGFALRVGDDGKLKWFPRRSSVTYEHITPVSTIDLGQIYDIGARYTLAGNATELHVDGVAQTDLTDETITFPVGDTTDLKIAIGDMATMGRAQTVFYDFRVYYEYLITTAEWANLFANKRSISDIPPGLVAAEGITQLEYTPPFTDGFTQDGFTH